MNESKEDVQDISARRGYAKKAAACVGAAIYGVICVFAWRIGSLAIDINIIFSFIIIIYLLVTWIIHLFKGHVPSPNAVLLRIGANGLYCYLGASRTIPWDQIISVEENYDNSVMIVRVETDTALDSPFLSARQKAQGLFHIPYRSFDISANDIRAALRHFLTDRQRINFIVMRDGVAYQA